jgi:hypothetical protein
VIAARDPPPWFLSAGGTVGGERALALVRRQIPHGSMLAYTKAFEHEGRTFLLSTDGTVVPADRVRLFRESSFAGTELGRGIELPIAFMRERARPRYRRGADACDRPERRFVPRSGAVELAPKAEPAVQGGKALSAARSGEPVAEADATVIRPREKLPFGVTADRYILFSITRHARRLPRPACRLRDARLARCGRRRSRTRSGQGEHTPDGRVSHHVQAPRGHDEPGDR